MKPRTKITSVLLYLASFLVHTAAEAKPDNILPDIKIMKTDHGDYIIFYDKKGDIVHIEKTIIYIDGKCKIILVAE